MRSGSERGLITLRTLQEGNWAVICISDTGGGIPEAIRGRVFEPFVTTKAVGEGSGQGLSMAHKVIVQVTEDRSALSPNWARALPS